MKKLSTVRPKKRERKKLQTPNPEARRRLIEAANDLIREGGYNSLRVETIAEQAGLSIGTFYLYFEGKADLFMELVIDCTEQIAERVTAAHQETPGTVGERLLRGFDAYLDFVDENRHAFLQYVRDASVLETDQGRLSGWAFDVHAKVLLPLIEEAIATNEFRPYEPELLAQALVGLSQHLAVFWLENRERYTREQIRQFLQFFPAIGVLVSSGATAQAT